LKNSLFNNFFLLYLLLNFGLLVYGLNIFSSDLGLAFLIILFIGFLLSFFLCFIFRNTNLSFLTEVNHKSIFIFYIIMSVIIILIGAPAFADDVDRSKVLFNNGFGILLIRVLKYVSYTLSFLISLSVISGRTSYFVFIKFLIISSFSMFLLGYKGDILSTLIISSLTFLSYSSIGKFKILILFSSMSFSVFYLISLRYNINMFYSLMFVLDRLTISNAEGLYTLENNIDLLKSFFFFDLLFGNVMQKIFSISGVESLNTLLMSIAKNYDNFDGMQLSTFGFGFTYLYFGLIGVALQFFLMIYLVFYLRNSLAYSKKNIIFKFLLVNYISGFFYGQEFLVNFIDFFISSLFVVVFFRFFKFVRFSKSVLTQ
jgi:hypothetical protein